MIDPKTHQYKGFTIVSYKAKGGYGHYRISNIKRPDGSAVDGVEWGFKFLGGPEGQEVVRGTNIGKSHADCFKWAVNRIDYELNPTPPVSLWA